MVKNPASSALIEVSDDEVAARAYEMYVDRGRADGFDRDDWRRAECELKAPAHYSYARAGGEGQGTTKEE